MGQVLVRNLDDAVIERLKQKAAARGTSLEQVAREALAAAAAVDERQAEVHAAVERGRAAFASGNLMSALREVKQALALDPNDENALALSAQTEQAIKERQ